MAEINFHNFDFIRLKTNCQSILPKIDFDEIKVSMSK